MKYAIEVVEMETWSREMKVLHGRIKNGHARNATIAYHENGGSV